MARQARLGAIPFSFLAREVSWARKRTQGSRKKASWIEMTPPPTAIRSKEVCMLERDWHDFGCALAETYPQARYYLQPDYINDPSAIASAPEPPHLPIYKFLLDPEFNPWFANRLMMVFDPQWEPQFKKYRPPWEPEAEWHWLLLPPPHPTVHFRLGGGIRKEPVPHLATGEISFYATPKEKDHFALAARVFRLFAKFATGRAGLVRVRVPSLEVTKPVGKGSPFWCGYHALEWTRGDPRRVLFYTPVGFGTRPTGKVVPLAEISGKQRPR